MDLMTLYHQANDAWNRHDHDAYVALYADDCEIVAPGSTGKGHQGVLDFWADSAGPFPDNRATPRTVVADGTTVVEESVWEGTNTGPLTMPDGSELPDRRGRVRAVRRCAHRPRRAVRQQPLLLGPNRVPEAARASVTIPALSLPFLDI